MPASDTDTAAVASYAQAIDKCRIHSQVVGFSGALLGFVFAIARVRQRWPDLVKRNSTVLPAIGGVSVIVGYALSKYSHGSCLDRYAAKFPQEAAEWKRHIKEEEEAKRKASQ